MIDDYNKEEMKEKLTDYVMRITAKSKGKNMYICPLCGSGRGKNRTGAFSINSKNTKRWKCFSCGEGGDIFDLIGKVESIDNFKEQVQRVAEIYGIFDHL